MRVKNRFKKIIVSIDLSPVSKNVASSARSFAKAAGSQLVFQFVTDPHLIALNRLKGHSDADLIEAEMRPLKRIAGPGNAKHKHRVSIGNPSVEIRKLASREKAGVIMMGSHGKGPLTRIFLGSTADSVAREADQSVWIVKGPHRKVRKIFVPIDGSEGSLEALETAVWIARLIKAKVQPVSVLEFGYVPSLSYVDPKSYDQDILARRKKEVDLWLGKIRQGLPMMPARVAMGHPSSLLPRLVKKTKSDLVVMSTHSRRGLGFTLLGKIAAHMIHRSPCSVFLIRPSGWRYKKV